MAHPAIRRTEDPAAGGAGAIDDAQWEQILSDGAKRLRLVSDDEARALFDQRARHVVKMSGEEFLRRYDAGEFDDVPDDTEHGALIELIMLVPLGR
jgi:hypothetical protein